MHGIFVDIEDAEHTGINLAAVVNGESASEAAHIEPLMRTYIERQYRSTIEIVKSHRNLLDRIVEMLLSKNELFQDDLLPLLKRLN